MNKVGVLIVLASLSCAGVARADDPCKGADGKWALGGAGFDDGAALAALMKGAHCPTGTDCTLTAADGVTYVIDPFGNAPQVMMKSRALKAGETLPFGVLASDSPDQALARIRGAGHAAGYGLTWTRKPVSVAVDCEADGGGTFMLEFRYDASGHMTGVSEKPIRGNSLYAEDVTYHVNMFPPTGAN